MARREFLYDLKFWEARRIVKGYRRRDRLKLQLMAECAYAALFAMRDPKGKTVYDLFPSLFEDDEEEQAEAISEEEAADLQELIRAANQHNPEA